MENTMLSLSPECMILFKNEEELHLRRWLVHHGYTYRNATDAPARPPYLDPEKPLPMNRINSLFIWNDGGKMSFTGASMIATTLFGNANPTCVFSVDEFVERETEHGQLFAEDGALLYEGQLYKGKPYGKGVVY